MAAVTLLGTATFDTATGTKTVTATPAVGDLIYIVTAHTGNVTSVAPTDNNSSGTYTLIATAQKATSADTLKLWARNALIPAAVSTIFTHAPGTTTGGGLAVIKVTGVTNVGANASPVWTSQSNQAAGAPTMSLGVPFINNPVIGILFNGTNPATMTPRAGYSELCDVGYNTPPSGLEIMAINSGETSATMQWGSASASALCFIGAVVETRVTHAAGPSALIGPGAVITGSAARASPAVTHATSGALTGPGAVITGSADHAGATVNHATSGALTGPGTTITGAAARLRAMATSGALTGPGAAIAGSAARLRAMSTSGALTGPGAVINGSAARTRAHATSGALTGPGAAITGTAARLRAMATSGALTGPGAVVTGSAARSGAVPNHATSGVLTGPGAVVTGAAARVRVMTSSGVLTGAGSSLAGTAARTRQHDASGALVGAGSVITGSATRLRVMTATGALVGAGSALNGVAAHKALHATSGALVGAGAILDGTAVRSRTIQLCMSLAQAQKLYEIWLLHGLGPPLIVAPDTRSAGTLAQDVATAGDTTTVVKVADAPPADIDVGTMVDELALLHGLDGATLAVTPTTRDAGIIHQSMAVAGDIITVTRQ